MCLWGRSRYGTRCNTFFSVRWFILTVFVRHRISCEGTEYRGYKSEETG
jgi:hypothetical protein